MDEPQSPPATISQEEVDHLLRLSGFLADGNGISRSLIDEIEEAILDSGKLSVQEWITLRSRLREVERLAPTIDLIIALKQKRPVNRAKNTSG
jgi:hypothetical protein